MSDPMPQGALIHVLLPQGFGRHWSSGVDFTVVSVEIWAGGIVVNVHVRHEKGDTASVPEISVEDHLGTTYSLAASKTVGSRNLQIFTPSAPPATRSLTIRSTEAGIKRLVVALAVPRVAGSAERPAI